jgi:hypothetical protein
LGFDLPPGLLSAGGLDEAETGTGGPTLWLLGSNLAEGLHPQITRQRQRWAHQCRFTGSPLP